MTDELENQIKDLEEKWKLHHKDPRNNPMPDMIELTKLRIKRDKLAKL
jgi:hypothetical protein